MTRCLLMAATVLLAAGAVCADPFTPDDPYYAAGYQWYAGHLGLPQAWDRSLGSTDVVVAVLDSGVMADTPDLAGRLLPPISATGGPPLDGTDVHHGTWVASSVGMGVDNGIGGAGVGNFRLLPVTITDTSGQPVPGDIADGIRMAADAGARVINISYRTLTYSELDLAAAYARTQGALTFMAAGNQNTRENIDDFENLIFVAGTDAADQRWEAGGLGSCWGPYVDLAAPADDILVADPHDPVYVPSGYGLDDGTSYASSLAAGAAALAWSICPDLTPAEVEGLLRATAVDLGLPGRDEVYGWGRVDMAALAEGAYALTPEPATLALLAGGLAGLLAARARRR